MMMFLIRLGTRGRWMTVEHGDNLNDLHVPTGRWLERIQLYHVRGSLGGRRSLPPTNRAEQSAGEQQQKQQADEHLAEKASFFSIL